MTDESVSSILALTQLVSLAIFNTGLTERGQVEQSCLGSDEDLRKAGISPGGDLGGAPLARRVASWGLLVRRPGVAR